MLFRHMRRLVRAEIIWLNTQLETANSEAEEFETNVCLELDNLPAGLRSNYEDWCPTTP